MYSNNNLSLSTYMNNYFKSTEVHTENIFREYIQYVCTSRTNEPNYCLNYEIVKKENIYSI